MVPRPPNPLTPLGAAQPLLQPANVVARFQQQPQVVQHAVQPAAVVQAVPVEVVPAKVVQATPAQMRRASVQAPAASPGLTLRRDSAPASLQAVTLPPYTAVMASPVSPVASPMTQVAGQSIEVPVMSLPTYTSGVASPVLPAGAPQGIDTPVGSSPRYGGSPQQTPLLLQGAGLQAEAYRGYAASPL